MNLKPSELRIGNLVKLSSKIETVTASMILEVEEGKVDVEPVELTAEVLEAAGFKKDDFFYGDNIEWWNKKTEELRDLYIDVCFTEEKKEVYIRQDMIEACLYLHNLQNLFFALVGEELTIKL